MTKFYRLNRFGIHNIRNFCKIKSRNKKGNSMASEGKSEDIASYFTLFVKFSRRIPNPLCIQDEVRSLYSNVKNVRKPRQKSARWILVDFESEEYAEEFKKILEEKPLIAKLPVKVKRLNIKQNDSSSKHDDNEHRDKINSLTKRTFELKKLEKYTNKLLVTNLSKAKATMSQLREWFPNNLDIDLKYTPKTRAIVTFKSAAEAMEARIALKATIAEEQFRVVVLLIDGGNKKRKSDNAGRYFESTIE